MRAPFRLQFEQRTEIPQRLAVLVPLLSVLAALAAGALFVWATGHDPIDTYANMLSDGFFSSTGPIASVTISALPAPGTSGSIYPTLDNMTFAVVPAPSVVALFGIAGACGRRRRA